MIRQRKPIARSTKRIERKAIRRRVTPKAARIAEACRKALDWYFKDAASKPCQICSGALLRAAADPAHLSRRWKGLHEFCHILAAHRQCHTWLDNSAHMDRIKTANASKVSCQTGGVIKWSTEQLASLNLWLIKGHDPINLGKA